MSFDIMIIEPTTVPTSTHAAFMSWYEETTEWSDDRDYSTTDGSTDSIAAFYNAITEHFPDLNAADDLDDEDDDDTTADYTIGDDFLYIGFDYAVAEDAAQRCLELAKANNLAFIDISGTTTIHFPDGSTLAH
ncbi:MULTISPECIES: hypothetical protein [unclassified Corynebacterium]|uniref:hypothetical protein n=1 Tax=unclassified Corynebacterium TaxID=2624378 RepID=UPI0008A644CA|nr:MULTISPECIES: hypothetical protein [unclassified Corynebacterium]OFK61589.1 hypothetical protein HMPREF2808_01720 [Corynebacterium sp. HMSC078A10]OFK94187.1 hypothetical protein HMPREF2792_08125 [Corynebacterium sp. HMSC068H04]